MNKPILIVALLCCGVLIANDAPDQTSAAIAAFQGHLQGRIKGSTETTVVLEDEGGVKYGRKQKATKTELYLPRFTIEAAPLTQADTLNGVSFVGVAVILANAGRSLPVPDAPPAPGKVRLWGDGGDKTPSPWSSPSGGGAFRVILQKGSWSVEPCMSASTTGTADKPVTWLCAKHGTPKKTEAELAALDREVAGILAQLGLVPGSPANVAHRGLLGRDPREIIEIAMTYRVKSPPVLRRQPVTPEQEIDGIEAVVEALFMDAAYQCRSSAKRVPPADVALPKSYCACPTVAVQGDAWTPAELLIITATKTGGKWVLSDSFGEISTGK